MTSLIKYFKKISFKDIFFCSTYKKMFSDLVQLNNLLAECFQSDLCTTRIYEKSYERQHTQNSLQRFFLSVHFHNIFGLFWAKHCIVWKLTDIDMKYPWREFSILCKLPFIAELTWIKSIRCGGFECPINDSTYILSSL